MPFKKARPTSDKGFTSQSYRLATGGEDNHVRVRSFAILAALMTGTEGSCLFWLALVVDDASKYHACISLGPERGGWGPRPQRCSKVQATQGGISRYSESAFSCR